MRSKAVFLVGLFIVWLASTGCTTREPAPDWTWVRVGETDKDTILQWFGEPPRTATDPTGFGDQPPWEYWYYDGEMYLGFLNSVVEVLWLPNHLDPLLQDGINVQQMLNDYGTPEIVYEHYTETIEGIGIDGWLFIYPSLGHEFAIRSMFVILSGDPDQPPPPALELTSHSLCAPASTDEWLAINDEKTSRFRGIRVKDVERYFERMNPDVSFREPIPPPGSTD